MVVCIIHVIAMLSMLIAFLYVHSGRKLLPAKS